MSNVLTAKEWLIVSLIAKGLKNKDIAVLVGNSRFTIKNCVKGIYEKLGMWNRVECALWYETHKGEQ